MYRLVRSSSRRWRSAPAVVVLAALAVLVSFVEPAAAAPASRPLVGAVELVKAGDRGVHVTGWAVDPDSSGPVRVRMYLDGHWKTTVSADTTDAAVAKQFPHVAGKHGFAAVLPATAGQHSVCLTALDIVPAGAKSRAPAVIGCRYVQVQVNPVGTVTVAPRAPGATALVVSGWAIDPETRWQIYVTVAVDGGKPVTVRANQAVPGLAAGFPGIGIHHGYTASLPVGAGAHTVCVVAQNVHQGVNSKLGCSVAPPVATVPGVVQSVRATALPGSARVTWTAPASNGGAPITSYRVSSLPATTVVTASASSTGVVVSGLHAGASYRFVVQAVNVAGSSPVSAPSPAVTVKAVSVTDTPPMISTSRYLRNLHANDPAGNRAKTFAMGAIDAGNNPSGHSYLILVQFGGQSLTGNSQSATPDSSLTYAQTVAAMQGYLDGYRSAQQAHAPVIIAVGTNNDRDVRKLTGRLWAQQVVNPLAAHARTYPHSSITVAGADDIEPGFLGTMSQSKAWVTGFLSATGARFVFNGSADGCGWGAVSASCNNGYTAAGIEWMAGGAAQNRILALPQIYNYTQPKQWKYISLTGAVHGLPTVNFAGPLTEWTACAQAHSCGSLTNNSAWRALRSDLDTDARTRSATLPYGTDLRIN